jgi:hypothetical protein
MGIKSAPKAPDPVATIEAQKDASRVNQYTPNGNVVYGSVDNGGNFIPRQGVDAVQTQESDFNRQLREGAQSLGVQFAGQISPQLGYVNSAQAYRDALNGQGASADALRSGLTGFRDINSIQNGLPSLNTDFSGASKQAQDAVYNSSMGLLRPELDLQRRRTEQSLADKGLPMGSEAYSGELNRLDTNQGEQLNRLALQSVLAGNDRQNQLFNQSSQARGQLFGENSDLFNMSAAQRAQQFGENQGVFNNVLQKQNWLSGLEQNQRSAQYNELASLLGLQQVPQFQNVAPVDAAGIIQAGYDTKSKNYQGQIAGLGSLLGAGAQLGSAALLR